MTVEVVAKKETQVTEVVVVVETQKEEKVAEENVEPRESSVEESKPELDFHYAYRILTSNLSSYPEKETKVPNPRVFYE